jgi:uncharacterized protein YbjT (DUF2867 family)
LNTRERRITLLGGSGFVGRELVARFARAGYRLRVLTRHASSCRHLAVLPQVECVVTNVHDGAALERHFAGSDVVINLVGILNERGFSGRGFVEAHAELTRKVVTACIQAQVPRLLHMSSLGAALDAPSHYLRSKGLAERYVKESPATLAWTIFRPSVIFGPHDSLLNRFASLLALSGGIMPLARAEARFAPVWVGDVASAFERALHDEATVGRSYDLCGPRRMSLRELVEYVGELTGRPAKVLALPDFVGKLQARVMDFVPGKPFSSDNFRSLSVDNVSDQDGLGELGIAATALETIAPTYLGSRRRGTIRE